MNYYPTLDNDFTRKEESDKIKSNNSYPTLSNQTPKLSSEQQKNINSAYKAKQGGFITDAQYKSNLAKNGVKTWEEKTPEFKPPKTNLNQTGVPKINTTKVKIPNEKLEQERLKNLTGQWDLKKVKSDELDNHIRLKNKRPDDYYREIVDDKEQQKRLDEAFGSKTDFSLFNYENNYDKFNDEEKSMFTHKMQLEFNRQGYRGKDGYRLKTDGILGPNTKKALEDYKKDNYNDYKEAVELKESNSSDLRKMYDELVLKDADGKPIILASTNHSLGGHVVSSNKKETLNQWLTKNDYEKTKKEFIKNIHDGLEEYIEYLKTDSPVVHSNAKKAFKNIWKTGADIFLEKTGCSISAWMLKHSLEDNPQKVIRDNNSYIANKIQKSKEYNNALDKKIKESTDGKISGKLEDVTFFSDKDLYFSINKANVYVDGYKDKNGEWFIKTTVTDTYDFTEILFFEDIWAFKKNIGIAANNAALISQMAEIITPYEVEITFYTKRENNENISKNKKYYT